MAFWGVEGGWGEERSDLRAGIVASTTANFSQGRGNRTFKPTDFIPKRDEQEEERMSTRQLAQTLDGMMEKQKRAR